MSGVLGHMYAHIRLTGQGEPSILRTVYCLNFKLR